MNPQSSEASARTWLLSSYGSQAQSTRWGYSGSSTAPMLYANKTVTGAANSSLVANPSFGGQNLPIASGRGGSGTSGSNLAYDKNTGTSWYTTSSGPSVTWFDVDLGATRQLTGVKWMFSRADGADKMLVRTSNDRVNWEIVGTYSNSGSLQTFYGANVNRTARYVTFEIRNPNNRPVLGNMSEMQVWGTSSSVYTPGTSRAAFSGSKLQIVGSRGSSNANDSRRVWDNNVASSWDSTATTPSNAWFYVDFGVTRQVSGIRWMFRGTTATDQMLVRTSTDRTNWTTVGTFENGGYDSNWYGTSLNRNARYVSITVYNLNRDLQIGLIRELEVWGQPYTASTITSASLRTAPTPTPVPTAVPSFTAAPSPTPSPTPTLVPSPTPSPTPTVTPTMTVIPSPTAEASLGLTPEADDLGTPTPAASPVAVSPDAPPAATPAANEGVAVATPEVTAEPTATEAATLVPTATPTLEPTATLTPEPTVTIAPTEEPSPTSLPTEEPTATATPTLEPTATPTEEPLPTEEPTPTPTPTSEPVSIVETGVISNAEGGTVRCRVAPSTEAEILEEFGEGDQVGITGEPEGDWVPVICGDEQSGFINDAFLDRPGEEALATETAFPEEDISTSESGAIADEPDPTEELAPTEDVVPTETPEDLTYTVVDTADSEGTGTGYIAVDGDSATIWSVSPSISPTEAWLVLDLGQVQPVDRVTWELGYGGALPPFEIWLSEDGSTWFNLSEVNSYGLEAGVPYEETLNAYTRFVRFQVPDVAESGLSGVGGLSEVEVWAADDAQALGALAAPVTPEPELEPDPADVPVDEGVTQEPPAESVEDETPSGEPTPDGSQPDGAPDSTIEETPPPQG